MAEDGLPAAAFRQPRFSLPAEFSSRSPFWSGDDLLLLGLWPVRKYDGRGGALVPNLRSFAGLFVVILPLLIRFDVDQPPG
jgi:hypothetical protein